MSGTWKDKRISHPLKVETPEETGVLLSLSIRTNGEYKMTLNFFGSLAKLLGGRRQSATCRNDLMTWAKTEYPKDWEFAYHYMITHDGKSPSHTHVTGVTL
jgi:hypothetical protein